MSLRAKKKTRAHMTRLQQKAIARGESMYVVVADKSNQHVYLQLRSPEGRIVFGASSLTAKLRDDLKGKKGTDVAYAVGKYFAEHVCGMKLDLSNVAFDRSGFPYIGRVAALAQGARDHGMAF